MTARHVLMRLSVYSSDSPADLIDAQVFDGCIFRNVDAIFQFLDMTYSKSIKVEGLYRTEKWHYPMIAVREGIMNAIIHRDGGTDDNIKHYLEGIIEGIADGIRNDVKPKLVTILYVLHERPGLRTNAIGERTNIPTKSIERYVDLLKKAGVIYYSGGKNTGGYYLSNHILRD